MPEESKHAHEANPSNDANPPNDSNQDVNDLDTAHIEADVFALGDIPAALAGSANTGGYLTATGAKVYLDRMKRRLDATEDPIAEMLVEQIALTHHRIATLHVMARLAEKVGEEDHQERQMRKQVNQISRLHDELVKAVQEGNATNLDLHKKITFRHVDADSKATEEATMESIGQVAIHVDRARAVAIYTNEAARLSRELRQLFAELRRHQAQTQQRARSERQAKDVIHRINPAESA